MNIFEYVNTDVWDAISYIYSKLCKWPEGSGDKKPVNELWPKVFMNYENLKFVDGANFSYRSYTWT